MPCRIVSNLALHVECPFLAGLCLSATGGMDPQQPVTALDNGYSSNEDFLVWEFV